MKLIFKPVELKDAKLIFDNRQLEAARMTSGITKKEFNETTLQDMKKQVKAWIADSNNGVKMTFLILSEDEYVGRCQLQRIDSANKSAAVSLQIKKECWGKGYGKETLTFLEQLAFSKLRLNRLEYCCYSNNERSRNLAEKCGYTFEGAKRQEKRIGAAFYDLYIYSKLKSEYKK